MTVKKDENERQFNKEKDEGIKKLLQSSFAYAVKLHDFDVENYYVARAQRKSNMFVGYLRLSVQPVSGLRLFIFLQLEKVMIMWLNIF